MRFRDRQDAGRRLAELLEPFRAEHPVAVGIPRGGVPVAAEVARALNAPLEVAVVCKVGAPHNPELALGALAEGGVRVLSEQITDALGLSKGELEALIAGVEEQLDRRVRRYRGDALPRELTGHTAIAIDDGLATGSSALAAIASLRKRGAARVILAVPVAAPQSIAALRPHADGVVCVEEPADLWAVGLWYRDFSPTSDPEVAELLERHATSGAGEDNPGAGEDGPSTEKDGASAGGPGAGEDGSGEDSAKEDGLGEDDPSAEEDGPGEDGPGEDSVKEDGPGEDGPGEDSVKEDGAGEEERRGG
jgi:putative phosphoribosyl transferase